MNNKVKKPHIGIRQMKQMANFVTVFESHDYYTSEGTSYCNEKIKRNLSEWEKELYMQGIKDCLKVLSEKEN